jgi:isocitrate lyase
MLVCFISSCNQDNDDKKVDTTDTTAIIPTNADTSSLTSNEIYDKEEKAENYLIWKTDLDNKLISKNPDFKNSNFFIDSIIKGLNLKYREIPLEKVKVGHDTLYTQIRNSEYLGEQIGSTGAAYYLAEVVINLTSVQGIKFVNMDFAESSHATPGVFTRKDFEDFKVIE